MSNNTLYRALGITPKQARRGFERARIRANIKLKNKHISEYRKILRKLHVKEIKKLILKGGKIKQ